MLDVVPVCAIMLHFEMDNVLNVKHRRQKQSKYSSSGNGEIFMASIPSNTPVCATCTNWAGKRIVNSSAILQVDVNTTGKCYLKGTTSTMVYRAFGGCMHQKSWSKWPALGQITPR
jgi:hypothetical protein